MWNEFFENPFNLQNLCMGIFLVTPLLASYFHQFFFDSLREKDKRLKDYLIIILGVLMVGLFLFSRGSYIGTLPENDPDAPASY